MSPHCFIAPDSFTRNISTAFRRVKESNCIFELVCCKRGPDRVLIRIFLVLLPADIELDLDLDLDLIAWIIGALGCPMPRLIARILLVLLPADADLDLDLAGTRFSFKSVGNSSFIYILTINIGVGQNEK